MKPEITWTVCPLYSTATTQRYAEVIVAVRFPGSYWTAAAAVSDQLPGDPIGDKLAVDAALFEAQHGAAKLPQGVALWHFGASQFPEPYGIENALPAPPGDAGAEPDEYEHVADPLAD